ncbi:hypothetical protein VTK56DRAFT_10219 [Thermocarpiscus australiensis]
MKTLQTKNFANLLTSPPAPFLTCNLDNLHHRQHHHPGQHPERRVPAPGRADRAAPGGAAERGPVLPRLLADPDHGRRERQARRLQEQRPWYSGRHLHDAARLVPAARSACLVWLMRGVVKMWRSSFFFFFPFFSFLGAVYTILRRSMHSINVPSRREWRCCCSGCDKEPSPSGGIGSDTCLSLQT